LPSGPLYGEDFEDGLARGWDLDTGWEVSQQGGNFVLHGQGHRWANLSQGRNWTDYAFKFRLKLLKGAVHLNYRLSHEPRFTRYYFGFSEEGFALSKQIENDFTSISRSEKLHRLNVWHTVEIRGFEGRLQVFVNGELELDVTDRDPLLEGTIAFETLDGSEVFIDDIEVLALAGPLEAAPTPTPRPVSDFIRWEKAASPPAHSFWSVTVAPSSPETIYVAARDANVWRSTDSGANWSQVGERRFGAHIFSNIAVHPSDPDFVFASNGFLHVSRDGGESWEGLFGSGDSLGVVSVAFAPGDPTVLYAGDDQSRLYRSDDTGSTWNVTGRLPTGGNLTDLWVDPEDENVLLAGTPHGLFRSEQGGTLLVEVLPGDIMPHTLTADTLNPGIAFVVQRGHLLRSVDGGQTWQDLNAGEVTGVTAAGDQIYVGKVDGVLVSSDGGATWQVGGYNPAILGESPVLAVDPTRPQRVYSASNLTLGRSEDGAVTWSVDAEGLVVDDFFTLAVDPANPDRLYAGLFWTLGMYRTDDGAQSWEWLPAYIHTPPGHEHYPMRIALDPRDTDIAFVTGAYGFRVTRDGGESWTPLVGDFHMHGLAISSADPDVIYVGAGLGDVDKTVPGTAVYKSTDGGRTWYSLDGGLPTDRDFSVYTIAVAENDSDRVYLGTNMHDWARPHTKVHAQGMGIFRSTDGGVTFEAVNEGLSERNVFALAVDPRDSDVVYAGTAAEGLGSLFKTTDGGETWTPIDDGLPPMDVHSIALWPTNPDVIVVGLARNVAAGTGLPVHGAGVFVSKNGGQTWADASKGLTGQGRVVLTLVFTSDGSLVYAGTDDGIYRGTVPRAP
jgi:photosystem II stability/assembly factor-like uncharacterized protein